MKFLNKLWSVWIWITNQVSGGCWTQKASWTHFIGAWPAPIRPKINGESLTYDVLIQVSKFSKWINFRKEKKITSREFAIARIVVVFFRLTRQSCQHLRITFLVALFQTLHNCGYSMIVLTECLFLFSIFSMNRVCERGKLRCNAGFKFSHVRLKHRIISYFC